MSLQWEFPEQVSLSPSLLSVSDCERFPQLSYSVAKCANIVAQLRDSFHRYAHSLLLNRQPLPEY
jgi:hypothetical protein